MKKTNKIITILIFIFLYIPMLVLIVGSFNEGKSLARFDPPLQESGSISSLPIPYTIPITVRSVFAPSPSPFRLRTQAILRCPSTLTV